MTLLAMLGFASIYSNPNEDVRKLRKVFRLKYGNVKPYSAAVVVLFLAGTLASCGSVSLGNASCKPNIQNPHQSNGSPLFMDAKMSMICTATVTDAWLEIKMQQKVNGSWRDVPDSRNRQTYGTVGSGRKVVIMTGGSLFCRNGTYRAAGKGGATYEGRPNQSGNWGYGNAATVTCR